MPTSELIRNPQEAMRSRATVERGTGIPMGSGRCGPEEAFPVPGWAPQHEDRGRRETVAEIVERAPRRGEERGGPVG